MIYEKEVNELLGADVYKTFLAAVDSGEISEQQMADIAFELHEKVGGDFKRARESKAFKCDRAAARTVLTNWYQFDLAEGQTDKLVKILESDNIALKPLAERIIKAQTPGKGRKLAMIAKGAKGVSKRVSKGVED